MRLEGFKGIIAATITPNGVSNESISDYLRFLYERGVRGVFLLGTMGEGPKLSVGTRERVAGQLVNLTGDKFLRIVHVGCSDFESTLKLTKHAEEINADAVSAVPPFFYRYDAESLAGLYSALGSATSLPLLLYNNPGRQGYPLTLQDVVRIFETVPTVRGIKDSSGDPDMILELNSLFGSSRFIACGGDNLLYYAFAVGVRAHVSAVAAIYPELAVGIMRAVERGDHTEAQRLQQVVNKARRVLKSTGPDTASYRYALYLRGLDLGPPLPPTRELKRDEKELLSRSLESINRLAEDVGGRA